LGELRYLAGGLPQSFEHIIRALRGELEQGHIKIDPGTEWEGNPVGAVSVVLSDILALPQPSRTVAHLATLTL